MAMRPWPSNVERQGVCRTFAMAITVFELLTLPNSVLFLGKTCHMKPWHVQKYLRDCWKYWAYSRFFRYYIIWNQYDQYLRISLDVWESRRWYPKILQRIEATTLQREGVVFFWSFNRGSNQQNWDLWNMLVKHDAYTLCEKYSNRNLVNQYVRC